MWSTQLLTLYCIYSVDCTLTHASTACRRAHTHARVDVRTKSDNERGRRGVQRCFVVCGALQQCGAVLHNDGWGRKWQHKWLLKRGNGSIYKNYVSLCLWPKSHVTQGCCVMPPDLGDFPVLRIEPALLKPFVILRSKNPTAGLCSRLCTGVTMPDLLGTGTRCKVEPVFYCLITSYKNSFAPIFF